MICKGKFKDFIKDGKIITAITTGMFLTLNAANVKPLKPSLDPMDIMKITGRYVEEYYKSLRILKEVDQRVNACLVLGIKFYSFYELKN